MRGGVVFGVVVVAFAAAVTFHATLAIGLAYRVPPARGLVALLVPPLAPCWGLGERMRLRSVGWIASVAVYVAARLLQ